MKSMKNIVKKVAVASMLISLGTGSLSTLQTDTASHVSAASLQQVSKTGLITNTSGLNVRTGASTSHKRIGGVYKNDRVQIVGQQGDWYKIKFGNGFGFINNLGVQIITNTPALTPMNKTGLITNKSGLNVRSGPSTSHSRIGGVYQNNRVQIVGQQGDWYKIKFGSGFGFINNLGVQMISEPAAPPTQSNKASQVVSYAKSWLNQGVRYQMGGTNLSRNGQVDCSYFIQQVFKHNGITLPRTTWEQVQKGTKVGINQLQPGDLVFFNTYRDSYWNARGNYSSHVGIYLGDNQFINAQSTGGIRVQTLKGNGYWDKVYTEARRVF